jgi:uncharacterized membrane-anchored protein YjiN (DUF445 family)
VPSNTRTTAVAVVLSAFLAGLVVGVAGELVYLIHYHRIIPSRTAGRLITQHLIDRLDRELKLDPQQRARIEKIVEARRQRIDTLWSSVRPAVMQEIDATNAEIEKVLKPDQLEKFKAMETRMRNRVRGGPGHHGQMPPPPPPPGG